MEADPALGKGRVRDLARRYLAGTPDAFLAVRELLDYLLRITIMAEQETVRITVAANPNTRVIGVRRQPLLLRNGHYLRLTVTLSLDDTPDKEPKRRLRVYSSSYQYQADQDGERWIVRYDYERVPDSVHPCSHVHVRATLPPDCQESLPKGATLERIHIPTGRVSIEAVIRMLVEQFGIKTNCPSEVWRPILAESEEEFERIAHRHRSGPAE